MSISDIIRSIGVQGDQPVSGSVVLEGSKTDYPFFTLTFKLDAARVAVTDAGASGSFGTLKLFDFNNAGVHFLSALQSYADFAEGADLTGGAGDAVFEIGVGTVAIAAAADGTLGATNDNIGADIDVTLDDGTGTGVGITEANVVFNGLTNPGSINLNWSGTAATIDASSYIDVTGSVTVVGVLLGTD